MTDISRRAVLGAVAAGGAAVSLGTLPTAIADASLQASIDVIAASRDFTGEIGHLSAEITNERPADGAPITVVGNVWGVQRMTQVPWDIVEPAPGSVRRYHEVATRPTIPPGETATVHFRAPGSERVVRLHPDKRAMLRIYDKGTEHRAHDTFVPEEVGR